MVKRIIPGNMSPWECEINDVKYVYPPGTEQMVPDEVAHVIDAWYASQEPKYPEPVQPEGGGGVSSWNDLTDKPFYEETAVLLQNAEIAFTESGEGAVAQEIGFELGGHYEVTWNGTAYSCTAVEFDMGGIPAVGVGDEGFASSGEPSGSHPFIIVDTPSAIAAEIGFPSMAIALDGSSSAAVSIVGGKVHTIDAKFLPDEAIGGVVIVTYAGDTQNATMTLEEIAKAVCSGKTVCFRTRAGADYPLSVSAGLEELAAGGSPAAAVAVFSQTTSNGVFYTYEVGMDGMITELTTDLLPRSIFLVSVYGQGGEWNCLNNFDDMYPFLGGDKYVYLRAGSEYYPLWSANESVGEIVFARYDGSKFEKFTLQKVNNNGKYPPSVKYETT